MPVAPCSTDFALIEKGFHALSDHLRLKILELLRSQELCVCEICEKLAVSQSKLSFHLKKLKEAQLVYMRQEGRWIYYRLNPAQIVNLEEYLAAYSQFTTIMASRPCQD